MLFLFFLVNNFHMKKLIVFLIICIFLPLTAFTKNELLPLFIYDKVKQVCVTVDNSGESYENEIEMGNKKFVYLTKEEGKELVKKKKIFGIQFYLEDVSFEDILDIMQAKVVKTQNIEEIDVIYAYTPLYQDSIYIDGKKVNLQIALKDHEIIAGLPLILTGY